MFKKVIYLIILVHLFLNLGVFIVLGEKNNFKNKKESMENYNNVYFAAGCFWGVESIFQKLDGVEKTHVGYMNGKTENPTYKSVCYESTGHAEVVEVIYDKSKISFKELCRIFWRLHDPTTLNRQGPDHGTQYRSAIFYKNEKEKLIAEEIKKESQKFWKNPIITEITLAKKFYLAEDYHQNYFKKNGFTGSGCHYLRVWD